MLTIAMQRVCSYNAQDENLFVCAQLTFFQSSHSSGKSKATDTATAAARIRRALMLFLEFQYADKTAT